MALTKVTGQVINDTTGLVVGVTTVGGGLSATDGFFSGITTITSTTESTSSTTGSLIVSGGVGIAKNLSIGGSVSIGGTLTYEDVTNIDSVGLITARAGVVVGSGITLSKDGDVFFTGIATGNGSGLTALNASNISSGTVPTFMFPLTVVIPVANISPSLLKVIPLPTTTPALAVIKPTESMFVTSS